MQDIKRIMQRTRRYWYVDGLAEIATGGILLAGGGLVWIVTTLPTALTLPQACGLALGFVVAVSLGLALFTRALRSTVEAAKERVTYPRTGFVAYRPPERRRPPVWRMGLNLVLLMVVSAVLGAVMAGGLSWLMQTFALPEWLLAMPVSIGLMLGLGVASLGYHYGLRRFYLLAAASLIGGLVVARCTDPAGLQGLSIYFVLMGGLTLAVGLLTLAGYLRRTRPAAGDPGKGQADG